MDNQYKLVYFNGRGKAEAIRYIFHYATVAFEDHRTDQAEWPNIKPTTPVGQLPVLEITAKDGKKCMLCQSGSIARTTAKWFKIAGNTPCEMAQADEVFECCRDVQETLIKAMFEDDASKKEQLFATFNSNIIPRVFTHLEKHVKENGGKNLAGGENVGFISIKYTYADLTLAALLDTLNRCKNVDWTAIESKFSGLVAIKKAVEETSDIKAYLENRPDTPF